MVERLTALEAAATPGPWESFVDFGNQESHVRTPKWSVSLGLAARTADAALIVAMRNDLPALLSQLREQRERAERAERCVEAMMRDSDKFWGPCGTCGLPMVRNPHPDAGKPTMKAVKVGYVWECVPCRVTTSANTYARYLAAERTVREQREVIEAAKRLRALHVKRDQMIDNDTWESEGAIPTYTAIANAESKLSTALAALPPVADERTEPA
jgi:hypothetical protein